MNILIVEDDFVVHLVLDQAMMEWGFDCDIVCNGLEAVQCARERAGQYDLCIMDVSMPVMDGIEAAQIIRDEWFSA